MTKKYNYIFSTVNKEDVDMADRICADTRSYSDGSRMPNKAKFAFAKEFLTEGDAEFSLFSSVSYEDIYADDKPDKCLAASYVADLRTQFLADILNRNPNDMTAHALYLRNKVWQVKLRERANLNNLQSVMVGMRLT